MTDISFRLSVPIPPDLLHVEPTIQAIQDRFNTELDSIRDKGNKGYESAPTKYYKRTYRLKNGWHMQLARVAGGKIIATIYNDATDPKGVHYASRVFGSTTQEQDPIHHGRWPERPDLIDRVTLARDVQAIIRHFNGGN